MNEIDIEKNWERFKKELLSIQRTGVGNLLKYLEEKTDMKTAPASTKFHLSHEGGLCQHSLNTLDYIREIQTLIPEMSFGVASIALVALIHDICKTNFYKKIEKWDKDHKEKTGQWRKIETWAIEDKFPLGHGEKSVIIALRAGLELFDREIAAIRWHMIGFDAGIHFSYPSGYPFNTSKDRYPLVKLLAIADQLADLKENL